MAYRKVFYTRKYQQPAPAIEQHLLPEILKKRKLEELRVALENGELEDQQQSDSCADTDDGESNASTSCTASPRCHRAAGLEAQQPGQKAETQKPSEAELARKAAESELLRSIYARLQQQHAEEEAKQLAQKHELEEQHVAASQQISNIHERLAKLTEAKHDLVKQLKQAMQEEQAAKQQQQVAMQQQQLQHYMQQQPEQWQQQQQQMQQQQAAYRGLAPLGIPPTAQQYPTSSTPRPSSLTSPTGHASSYSAAPTPSGGFTPRGGLPSPPGTARSQWLFSTPAQPPPPPPRQQQQPLSDYQLKQHIADPAIAGTHGPLHGSAGHLGSHNQQQQQQQGVRVAPGWGQPPPRPGEQQRYPHAAGNAADPYTADKGEQHLQQTRDRDHQHAGDRHQQYLHDRNWQERGGDAAMGTAGFISPRRSYSGSGGASIKSPGSKRFGERYWHHSHMPPDSPEEGEALPSPPVLPGKSAGAAAAPQASTGLGAAADVRAVGSAVEKDSTPLSGLGSGPAPAGGMSSAIRRTSSGGGYGDRMDRLGGTGGLLRSGSGSGFAADRSAEQPALLRTSSTGGGGSGSHIISPPSSGGSMRGGGGLGRSYSASIDSRSGYGDRAGTGDRSRTLDRDAGGRQRTQQGYVGGGMVGRSAEDSGQHVWRGERRRSGMIDRFGDMDRQRGAREGGLEYMSGDLARQGSAGGDRGVDRGDRGWNDGVGGARSARGMQAADTGSAEGKAWGRNPAGPRGREGGYHAW